MLPFGTFIYPSVPSSLLIRGTGRVTNCGGGGTSPAKSEFVVRTWTPASAPLDGAEIGSLRVQKNWIF
ncbi:hypothetical protein QR680_004653 [Steinernema hermaphroditum]|uniref:Uncharacterized protein n=1 Tax=Steinernema hermaphroditum TaxID=289476 RepID=A0AA39HPD6_9BILA|nr:hypothetical protein QR680_004653 [Steinernema hermaphroditum]